MQSDRSVSRRAHFQLWMFSYTARGRPSKKCLSRLMMAWVKNFRRQGRLSCPALAVRAFSDLKRKTPARLPGGRNSNCGFSPSTASDVRQKNGCQDSCWTAAARGPGWRSAGRQPRLLRGSAAQPKYFGLDLSKVAMYAASPTQRESECLSTTAP